MNNVALMGRLTKDPNVTYTGADNSMAVARYTLAVDRRVKRDTEGQTADFISCVAFGKSAEFAEKYFKQGMKIAVIGHIQTGSYVNKEGVTVYTTDVVIDNQEFAESKNSGGGNAASTMTPANASGNTNFMSIPDGNEEELPFN